MSTRIDLDGRFAVVTGGAQGIGRAISERFLNSGAVVAIWDRDRPLSEKTAQKLNRIVNEGALIEDTIADLLAHPTGPELTDLIRRRR